MKYVAAFLLARLAAADTGVDVDAAAVKAILASVDCKVDEERLAEFMGEVEGKDVAELIANGTAKFASFGGGGGGAAAAPAAAAGGAAPAAEEKKAAAPVEESDEDMGDFGLFD